MKECIISGWGQYLQSFCKSTMEYHEWQSKIQNTWNILQIGDPKILHYENKFTKLMSFGIN